MGLTHNQQLFIFKFKRMTNKQKMETKENVF